MKVSKQSLEADQMQASTEIIVNHSTAGEINDTGDKKVKRSLLLRSVSATNPNNPTISPVSFESPSNFRKFTFDIEDLHRDTDKLTRGARKRIGRQIPSTLQNDSSYYPVDNNRTNNITPPPSDSLYSLRMRSTSGSFHGGTSSISTASTASSGTDSNRHSPSVSGKNTPVKSKSLLSKIVRWHRGKKVDKLRDHLDSLFPKLKTTEDEVNHWLDTVCDQREEVWQHGQSMLTTMQGHIDTYTKHLNLLEDTMNDIRQLDYDVLKEIEELRIAFAFNQELLHRDKHNTTKLSEADIRTSLQLTINDATGQDMFRFAPPSGVAALVLGSGRSTSHGMYPHPPGSPTTAPSQSFGEEAMGSSSFEDPSVVEPSLLSSGGRCDSSQSQTSIEKISTVPRGTARSLTEFKPNFKKNDLHWDGSELKRKCLMSSSISVQELQLSNLSNLAAAQEQEHKDEKKKVKENRFSSVLLKKVTTRKSVGTFSTPEKSFGRERDSSTPPPGKIGITSKGMNSPIESVSGKSDRRSSIPMLRMRSASTGSVMPVTTQEDQCEMEIGQKKRRRDTLGAPKKLVVTCDRLPYMLETFSTEEVSADDLADPDQKEMVKRLDRCLSLKDTLKTVLFTIDNTQEEETLHLKRIKKLRNDLQNVMDGAPRWVQLKHSNSLHAHHPPLPVHHHQHHEQQHQPFLGNRDMHLGASSGSTCESDNRSHHSKTGYYVHANEGSICSSLCSFDHADHSPVNSHKEYSPPPPVTGTNPADGMGAPAAVTECSAASATIAACESSSVCDKTDVTCTTSESHCACASVSCSVHFDGILIEGEAGLPVSPCSSSCTAHTSVESLSRSSSGYAMPRPRPTSVSSLAKLGIAELSREDTDSEISNADTHHSAAVGVEDAVRNLMKEDEPVPTDLPAVKAIAGSTDCEVTVGGKSPVLCEDVLIPPKIATEDLEVAVSEVVGDLRALLQEEKIARDNLDRIHDMLENAHLVHIQLDVSGTNH